MCVVEIWHFVFVPYHKTAKPCKIRPKICFCKLNLALMEVIQLLWPSMQDLCCIHNNRKSRNLNLLLLSVDEVDLIRAG